METLDGCKVLVTGAQGFLGRHLIGRLQAGNPIIHAITRGEPAETPDVHWWRGDLRDSSWIRDVVNRIQPDVVFHLASASLGGQNAEFVLPTFENDLLTTVNLLLSLTAAGCRRLILTASLEEPPLDGRPITISSPYAAAKVAGTFYGLMFHQLYGIPVTILRPYMTYGPGQKPFKVIPYTILSMLQGQPPRLSSGVRPVDWVYVDDVISAFLAAAVRPEAIGKLIDLGSGTLIPVRDAIDTIHSLIPDAPRPLLGALPDRMIENIRCADTSTAIQLLNWKATTTLTDGLSRTITWYREHLSELGEATVTTGSLALK